MCGDTEVGKFVQDEEARVNGIEHHNGMCGDTEDGNFVEGIDETICPKSNQMSVEEGYGVLDYEGDGVHLSQTNDVIQQANLMLLKRKNLLKTDVCTENQSTDFNPKKSEDIPNFCSNHNDTSNHIGGLSTEAKPSSSSSNPGNDKDASHLDDIMEIDGENVDNYRDDYMLMLNDEEKPVKPSLNDMELEQEPDKTAVKQGILEQQPNAPKKTTVIEETVGVKVEEKYGLGRGVGPLKVKKKNCQRVLRPNYLLRSAKDRKKKLAMDLKPPFGQQSATTSVPKKRKSMIVKTEVIVPPFDLEDISGQPRIWSINDIMTHEPFVENLSRPDDCKSDKVVLFGYVCPVLTLHLDLWIDLMWSLKPPEADWAIVSPHFSRCILFGIMPDYFSNGHMYPLPWQAVEKVYFLVNEPKTHWCLAELEIRTGVVTFYDSLGWASRSRRRWWRRMKKLLPDKLTVYLVMHGIFESKGISADDYKITYKYADAPFQASLFGACGIWVSAMGSNGAHIKGINSSPQKQNHGRNPRAQKGHGQKSLNGGTNCVLGVNQPEFVLTKEGLQPTNKVEVDVKVTPGVERMNVDPETGKRNNGSQVNSVFEDITNMDGGRNLNMKNTKPHDNDMKEAEDKIKDGGRPDVVEAKAGTGVEERTEANPKEVGYIPSVVNSFGDDTDTDLAVEDVRLGSIRYVNTLYGYFVGWKIPFPTVKHQVMMMWKQFGIEDAMRTDQGYFFFKFSNQKGLNEVLEKGPWMIKNIPMFVKKWTPNLCLTKPEQEKVPVWVRLHDIPLEGYTGVGISKMASTMGYPLAIDTYTADMCSCAWGRPSYARVLVEVSADKEWKEQLVIGVPRPEGEGKTKAIIRVEYEWRPPRCSLCKVYGHDLNNCVKHVVIEKEKETLNPSKQGVVDENGFQEVTRKSKHVQHHNTRNSDTNYNSKSGVKEVQRKSGKKDGRPTIKQVYQEKTTPKSNFEQKVNEVSNSFKFNIPKSSPEVRKRHPAKSNNRFSVLTSMDHGLNENLEEGIVEDIGDDDYEVASEKGDTATFMVDTSENFTLENMDTQVQEKNCTKAVNL
ncbi:phospholipase-like protein [Tanacetum coccineum]